MWLKLGWFRKVWSILDFLAMGLSLFYVIADFSGMSLFNLRSIASVNILLLWTKSFYFFRIFDHTAPMIRMILNVVKEIRWFLTIFLISVFAFA